MRSETGGGSVLLPPPFWFERSTPSGKGRGPQEEAVLIGAAIAVAVTGEFQGIPLLEGGIALGGGFGLPLAVHALDAGDISVRIPAFSHVPEKVSLLVEVEHVVQPQVDAALAVVVEEV